METAVKLSESLLWLLIGIFIVIYASKDNRVNKFVRGLIIVCFSLQLLRTISNGILSYTFDVWQWYDTGYRSIILSGFNFNYFLLLFSITLLIGFTSDKTEPEIKAFSGEKRSILLSLLLFVITGGIYFPFWLYRTVRDLERNYDAMPYKAGQAVGFLFIPIFNIYWIFNIIITLPLVVKQIETKHFGNDPKFLYHPLLIILLWFSFIIISNISQMNVNSDEFDFVELVFVGLFPYLSLTIILLTIQAKINTFLER